MEKKTINVQSEDETKILAESFTKNVQYGGIILLHGNLGSGKTTFVQYVAKSLGIEKPVLSPTFPIIRSYKIRSKNPFGPSSGRWHESGVKNFYHIDLYRISRENDLKGLGIKEIFDEPNAIVAIEWAEKLGSFLPKKRWDMHFTYIDEFSRKIVIEKIE